MTSTTGNTLTRRERFIYRTSTSLVLGVMVFSIVNFDPLTFLALLTVSYFYFEKTRSSAPTRPVVC